MDRKRFVGGLTLGVIVLAGSAGLAWAEPETKAPDKSAEKAGQFDPKAVEIIENFITKVGGRDLISSIESVHMTGTMSIPSAGITGTMEIKNKTPGKMVMVMDLPGFGKTETGYDGTVGWSSDPLNGPRLLTDEEVASMDDQTDPAASLKYKENNSVIALVGETDFKGQKTNKIRLVGTDGRESFEYYSVESGLLVGSEGVAPSPMGEINVVSTLENYKEFGGMKMPTKMVQSIGPQQIITTVTSVKVNEVDDSAFAQPEAVKALVAAKQGGAKTERKSD